MWIQVPVPYQTSLKLFVGKGHAKQGMGKSDWRMEVKK